MTSQGVNLRPSSTRAIASYVPTWEACVSSAGLRPPELPRRGKP